MKSPLVEFLCKELHLGEREVDRLIQTAPNRYKVYFIPKKSGGRREIAQPAPEVKAAQRAIVRGYLAALPVHECATAYADDCSILKNASRHSNAGPILKYDFKDFFPSITESAWISFCLRTKLFDRDDAIRSGRILFRRPKGGRILRLSIGAPSSPMVSNILMYEFDDKLHRMLARHNVVYTRYADDMTFSAPRTGHLFEVPRALRATLASISHPKLALNPEKTALVTKKYQRNVTGLVLAVDGAVTVGRHRKRIVRSGIHHYLCGKLDLEQTVKLAGMISFIQSVEPEYFQSMVEKHGRETINEIMKAMKNYKRSRQGRS